MSRTISANLSGGLTLTNTADSPVYIAQGVSIGNTAGAALIDSVPFYWSVTNATEAQIDGSSFGVSLNNAGTVLNLGSIAASNTTGSGFSYNPTTRVLSVLSAGLYVDGGGISNSQTGTVSGVLGVALGGAGSVINAGVIEGTATGAGSAIVLATGGSVTNLTGGTISGGNYGILSDGVASVSNQSSATISGTVRGVFAVNGSASVANQGEVSGGAYGVQFTKGGTVGNLSGGAISGGDYGVRVATALGSVTNDGSIGGTTVAGILLAAGGTVSNQSGGTVDGGEAGVVVETTGGSVTNQGYIEELDPYTSQASALGGVLLLAGGSVDNSAGTITGASYGVDVANAAGTVTNTGLIENFRTAGGAGVILLAGGSVGNSGIISSQGYSVLVVSGKGTVTNTGLIASYVNGGGAGVALLQGGSVTNGTDGDITGGFIGVQIGTFGSSIEAQTATFVNQGNVSASDNEGDGAAVWMHGPGVVINRAGATIEGGVNGTIVGGPLAGFSSGPFGIVAYYQTTVINYGSIGGGTYNSALYHAGTLGPKQFAFEAANTVQSNTIANLIEMAPGASFGGVVKGTDGTGSATLELLSGASAGTISSFGSVTINGIYYQGYLGFGAVKLDNGASWRLGGTVAAATDVSFDPTGTGTLTFVNPSLMQGTVTGFALGDTIGLAGVTVTGSNYASGVLTLSEASGGPIDINLSGNFTTGDFHIANVSGTAEITLLQTQDRTLNWTGDAGVGFATSASWDDVTNGLSPAQTAPGATDTVVFNSTGGAVIGTGTVLTMDVGSTGSGALQLNSNATIVTGSLEVGGASTAIGQLGLTGNGTDLTVTGLATVADSGTGVLSVLSGATFAATTLTIGSLGSSSGALLVSGAGSVVNVTGALNIGTALGTGELTVGAGAAVHAGVVNLQGAAVLEGGLLDPSVQLIGQGETAGGFGTIEAGVIIDEGVIQAGSNSLLVVDGTVLGGGTLTVNNVQSGTDPAGLLQINAGGTLQLTGAVRNSASTTFTDTMTPAGTYTVNHSVVDVVFADGTGVLQLDDIEEFRGTITTGQAGDEFVITGGTLSDLAVSNGNTLTMWDSNVEAGGNEEIIFASAVSAADFNILNNNTVQVACFAAGTAIRLEQGTLPVERLMPGMRVRTHRGDALEIVWIGHREIDCGQHPDPATVYPVRVLAGAFGPGMPSRDLWLSPDHAVFAEGVLIPIRYLINDGTIRQIIVPEVTYYHVELAEHDVILAEDLAVESYLDTGNRANFSNAGGVVRLFPDFSARMWEMAGCAPLITTGPVLERLKQALAQNHASGVSDGAPQFFPSRAYWARLDNRYMWH